MKQRKPDTAAERFASSYTENPATGCWLWSRSVDTDGYGRLHVEGRLMQAHRFAMVLAGSSSPPAGRSRTSAATGRASIPSIWYG